MKPRGALREPRGGVCPHLSAAALAQLGRGERPDRRVETGVLTGYVGVKLGGPMPEQHDVGRLEQRPVSIEQPGRAVTGEDRELHIGRLARRGALPVEEVRVPVHEPEPAAARHRLEDAEEKRAVAAEHEWALVSVEQRAHTRGDRHRRAADVARADYARLRISSCVADACSGRSGIARAHALEESGCAECRGRLLLAPPRPRAVERGVDDGQSSHSGRVVNLNRRATPPARRSLPGRRCRWARAQGRRSCC